MIIAVMAWRKESVMARYIDADALKPDYIVGSTSTNTECYRYVSLKQIMNVPTADVVEVVRCKDCKWKQGSECVRFAEVRPFPDDFCSRAERSNDE